MSSKERRRIAALEQVKEKKMSLAHAAKIIGISYRQAKRVWKRFALQGHGGLVHRSRGREGNRRKAAGLREKILAEYAKVYPDFGPTLACEHLAEHGLHVDHETLRRWLLAAGQWLPRRKRSKHRQWRERKECFGEMVQMDGSEHDWFEGRGPRGVLMVMIDDATNHTIARFFEGETTRACYQMMELWIKQQGVPASLYVDRDSIYRCERLPTIAEQIAGTEPQTHFGRAMGKLGVNLILANSPQAKGRVERRNAVFQDRLVKEMRLAGIKDLQAGNEFLRRKFLPKLNKKFQVKPRLEADGHLQLNAKLNEVLCWEEERVVQNDWTVVWKNRWFQIEKQHEQLSLVGKKVVVRELRNGQVHLLVGERRLAKRKIPGKPARKEEPKKTAGARQWSKPAEGHPWKSRSAAAGKEFFKKRRAEGALVKRAARQAGAGSIPASLRSASIAPAPA